MIVCEYLVKRAIKNTNKETVHKLDLERDDSKNSLAHVQSKRAINNFLLITNYGETIDCTRV